MAKDMRIHIAFALAALFSLTALVACSDDDPVKPKPPESRTETLHYDFRFSDQGYGYTLKKFEYADAEGNVIEVKSPIAGLWDRDITLKTGDRVYMRAEFEYDMQLWAVVQISSPPKFDRHYDDYYEDGGGRPGTCTIEIDEIFK